VSQDLYADFDALKFDRPEPDVLRVMMSNPGRLNAVDHAGHRQLGEVWKVVDQDPETRVAIITGEGGVFSAGGDLDMVRDMTQDFETRIRILREARDLVYNVIDCSKPIVSAIEGPAVGAGLVAGLLADISIAGRSARLIDGHTRLGVAAGDHSVIIWPLLVGMAKAKYHLLTCEPLSGEEAERMGLVSLCVDDGQVQDKAVEVAVKLAEGSQSAVRWTKYALNNWLRSFGPHFDASLAMEFLGFDGPDVQEGMAAIKAKRRPSFGGPAEELPGGRGG